MEPSDVVKRKLAAKYNISLEIVEEIVLTPFKIIKREIETADRKEANYSNFRILKLGIFYVSNDKRTYLRRLMNNEVKGKKGFTGSGYLARKLKKLQYGETEPSQEQSSEVCAVCKPVND